MLFRSTPKKHFNTALDVLSDIIQNPIFDEKIIEKERQVIFEEIKLKRDNPVSYVFKETHKSLFDNPFGEGTLGNVKSLKSINRIKMAKKFEEVYQPDKMILCVVGDANFEEIVKFAEKNFKDKKGEVAEFEIKLKNESKIEKRKGLDQANLVFAYHVPFEKDKGYAAQLLSKLMAEGMSSRLFGEIREKRNLAYAVQGGSEITKDFGYNFIYVGTMKENVEKVKKLIMKEFEKVAEELDENELRQIKEQMIGNHQIGMEDSQSQMIGLLYHEIDGNARDFYEFEKKISKVKLEDVKKLAKKAIEKFNFFALVPEQD